MTQYSKSILGAFVFAVVAELSCESPPVPLETECRAVCSLMCFPDDSGDGPPDVEGCTDTCVEEHATARQISAICEDAHRNFYTCVSDLSCDQALAQALDREMGPCGNQWLTLVAECESLFQAPIEEAIHVFPKFAQD